MLQPHGLVSKRVARCGARELVQTWIFAREDMAKMTDRRRNFTRRGLLKAGGTMAAVAAIPARAKAAATPPGKLMTTLSTYMAEAANKKLPDAVQEKSKQMILDTLAAMISGAQLPPGKFAIGSAASAACMAGLSAQQMRWLLSYTAQSASGLASWQRDTQHIEKSFDFGGMPARNGITAALLVQAGGTALDDIFSGADNFLEAFKPMNDSAMLIEALGERYEIMRTDVKKWTVGAPIQAPLDAMANLMQKNRFTADQVQKVAVRAATDEATIVDNREIPDISLQHLMAVMLVDKTVTFKTAHDEARMKDPTVLKERAKEQLVRDGDLEKLMPKRVAVVELTMSDGKMLSERVETVRGTAGKPMKRGETNAKARGLLGRGLGSA